MHLLGSIWLGLLGSLAFSFSHWHFVFITGDERWPQQAHHSHRRPHHRLFIVILIADVGMLLHSYKHQFSNENWFSDSFHTHTHTHTHVDAHFFSWRKIVFRFKWQAVRANWRQLCRCLSSRLGVVFLVIYLLFFGAREFRHVEASMWKVIN